MSELTNKQKHILNDADYVVIFSGEGAMATVCHGLDGVKSHLIAEMAQNDKEEEEYWVKAIEDFDNWKYDEGGIPFECYHEVGEMGGISIVRLTLRTLRSLRDAGDEEVEKWHKKIKDAIQIDYFDSDWDNAPTVLIDKLRDIVITRGQQLREIRESCPCNCHNQPSSKEAMGLDEHSNCGECIKGLLDEADAMQDSLCEKYESELREAREEIERLNLIVCELKDNFGEMEVGA